VYGDFLFHRISAVDGVEEDIGIDEGAHGSVAVEIFTLEFDAFGIAAGLTQTSEHGFHGIGGLRDGLG
jgi:hypothetical protein